MNNRILLIIFVACLAIFLVGRMIQGNRTSSFDPVIVKVDTAKVDRIHFVAVGDHPDDFELKRTGNTWMAVKGSTSINVAGSSINSILEELTKLTGKRIVTNDASKYGDYEITDAQAGKVTIYEGSKQVGDLKVGGFRFDQATRSASSYIKDAAKPEVYEIDGFLSMGLKARFDQFRDKKLVKVKEDDLTSIEWTDNQKKQTIQKADGAWHYAGMEKLDSTAFKNYLSELANAQGSEFSDLKSTAGLNLAEKVTLYGNNMVEPTVISAYMASDTLKPYLITSSAIPDAIFKSDAKGLYKRIFSDLRPFWPGGK
ncbi:MAG TPA: DUF4340 domain-containing protein [Saprospiraceae bacterium]|nr:DUF4340 domain-containing protein [Saprospiraceae bacterium]